MNKIQELLLVNMKRVRQRLGYSQMKLAEICNLSTSFIAEIETGKKFPSSSTLLKISEALGLKPYQLFMEKEEGVTFEKHKMLTALSKELKDNINQNLENIIKKYLSQDFTKK